MGKKYEYSKTIEQMGFGYSTRDMDASPAIRECEGPFPSPCTQSTTEQSLAKLEDTRNKRLILKIPCQVDSPLGLRRGEQGVCFVFVVLVISALRGAGLESLE